VDKKTALALWDSAVLPPNIRKKRTDEREDDEDEKDGASSGTMAFTVITKKGNKQQVMSVPTIFNFELTKWCIDTPNCRTFGFCLGCSYSYSSNAGQSRATTSETPRLEL
jgi:hypothetical protein